MTPENFLNHPFGSVSQSCEGEIVAQNVMKILTRTGNRFRTLSWEEYKIERLKDGSFSENEKKHFNQVIKYCIDIESALSFCPGWNCKNEKH